MGGIVRRDAANVYHTLPDARGVPGSACWHCCEPIHDETQVIPLPRVYDASEGVYHVYGRTCSPACAKAYVIEHTTFDRGQHMNTLVRMLGDLYGITNGVVEAPPRPALKRFGGTFDPTTLPKASCRLVQPPFVSYCMVVEEHVASNEQHPSTLPAIVDMDVEDADGLDEPPPPAAFESFLQERSDTDIERRRQGEPSIGKRGDCTTADANPPRVKRARGLGPMSKFFK